MKEVLNYHEKDIQNSDVLKRSNLKESSFFVVSAHREENIDADENFNDLIATLNGIAEFYKKRIIFSTHPRTMKRINNSNAVLNKLVEIMKPLGFFDYIKLQMKAFCVISDSGTITEESSILNFPAITIRQSHERPEGMDSGTLIMSGLKIQNVIDSINIVTSQYSGLSRLFEIIPDYNEDNVSNKVVRIIQSYTDYINRNVWKKN
jgi:UDP-N-acetylglucosamine 2-epimerase (non-hydrolysing)